MCLTYPNYFTIKTSTEVPSGPSPDAVSMIYIKLAFFEYTGNHILGKDLVTGDDLNKVRPL
jgi:hypothetical protein